MLQVAGIVVVLTVRLSCCKMKAQSLFIKGRLHILWGIVLLNFLMLTCSRVQKLLHNVGMILWYIFRLAPHMVLVFTILEQLKLQMQSRRKQWRRNLFSEFGIKIHLEMRSMLHVWSCPYFSNFFMDFCFF